MRDSRTLPHPDAEACLEAINGIAAAESLEAVWRLTVAALNSCGFERINYGYTRYRTGLGIGDPLDALFLSTHSLEKVIAFHESGLYLKSADFRWVRENVGAMPWGWVNAERAAGRLSAEEANAVDTLGAARRRAGYSISFPEGLARAKGAMGLGAPEGVEQVELTEWWGHYGPAVMAIANIAHFRISQMPLPAPRVVLTERQREVLDWIADGKSLQDVCVIMGLSLSAVEKHLAKARELLSVETTAQAVAKLAFLNQLFVKSHA